MTCLVTGYFYTKAVAEEDATWPHVRMTIPIDGAKTFHDISRDVVVNACIQLGMTRPRRRANRGTSRRQV